MIMLIGSAPAAKSGFLHRWNIIVDDRIILGMKVMEMTVPISEKLRDRQKERIKRKVLAVLRKLRINAVCVKENFLYPDWFSDYRKITGNDIIKRLLGKIAVMVSEKHELVYVYMHRADRDSLKALSDLCEEFRFVCISVQSGEASEIAENLMKNCGASVITEPTAERIKSADAAVFFAEPVEAFKISDSCVVVDAQNTEVEFCMTDGTEPDIPDGYPQKALVSEAILRGCIRFEDIQIKRIKIAP